MHPQNFMIFGTYVIMSTLIRQRALQT